jgi:alkylation response protein AidB-like acyl-CoA dehydrogenase
METLDGKTALRGGEFLVRETDAEEIFTPEEWTEEQRMIAQTCRDFLAAEVLPRLDEIDSMKDPDLMPHLLDKAGELGLLGTAVPEQYGGFGMDFNTSMLVAEEVGKGHSFAVALSAHTGIGTLPILYYGTEEQKARYLPKLASGEWKASYCLTEPGAGSDANAGKTRAVLSDDGRHYLITGQKMWITNGGFADLFIVFAKIDRDEKLTAFIVEKGFGNITMNPEERKMGIKGSSTRQIFFNETPVPVGNMLSERQNGFRIALNILNIGRIKLGIAAIGGAKGALEHAIRYANERVQFGRTIGSFGAIKHKIGDVAAAIYASESAHYRAGQNIDDAYHALLESGKTEAEAKLQSTEQFAIECAILKVHGSEVLDYSTDEGVQIFGGMGFSAEGPMDRAYRDSRINRIFEGTNEINRMLCIDMLLKKAMKGELDLMGPAMAVARELTSIPDFGSETDDAPFARERKILVNLKKAGLMIAGAAVQKFLTNLKDEQEILMHLADMLIEGYAAESALLRTEKMIRRKGETAADLYRELTMIYLHRAVAKCALAGREAICASATGDEQRMMLMGLKRFTKIEPYNLVAARRKVADYLLAKNSYAL